MTEVLTKSFRWSELFDGEYVYALLSDLKYFEIDEVQIDKGFQRTELIGYKKHDRSSQINSFELIPNEVKLDKEKNLQYCTSQTFRLIDYPQIVEFIRKHCCYIYDFIDDENINEISILCTNEARRLNSLESVIGRIKEYGIMKSWLVERQEQQEEIVPIILAALIQKFYQQDSTISFNLSSITATLSRIKSNVTYVNTLLNHNIDELKTYKLDINIDPCIKNNREFEFLNNKFFKTDNFELYNQNMDLKFLSYISCTNLRDKALNGETIGFGESYPKHF